VSVKISVPSLREFDSAFGEIGLMVGPRTGPNKRTKDDKEWYVVRRFLKEAALAKVFQCPLTIQKTYPPAPDFLLENANGAAQLEITEATDEADQIEMTKIELSNQSATLIGEFGGRFSEGASQPGRAWASDVIDAISRKEGKSIFQKASVGRHLIIYPNSNASSLLFDGDDEREAFAFLEAAVAKKRQDFIRATNGCLVHILGKEHIFLDVTGAVQIRPCLN